jgi:hypothetical protein
MVTKPSQSIISLSSLIRTRVFYLVRNKETNPSRLRRIQHIPRLSVRSRDTVALSRGSRIDRLVGDATWLVDLPLAANREPFGPRWWIGARLDHRSIPRCRAGQPCSSSAASTSDHLFQDEEQGTAQTGLHGTMPYSQPPGGVLWHEDFSAQSAVVQSSRFFWVLSRSLASPTIDKARDCTTTRPGA